MDVPKYAQIAFVVVVVITGLLFVKEYLYVQEDSEEFQIEVSEVTTGINLESTTTDRIVSVSKTATLPIGGIVQKQQVKHSIPLDEVRQGCSRQDCIPSVDNPKFISIPEALNIIASDQIGIALSYKGVERFYPFSMLVTHEIVNDTIAGDPLLVTYCPLCGTGIVFERTVDEVVYEFGVSGMLWQSNLLMYNRSESITDRNLWSQVLGEAVVGESTGAELKVVTSDIMQFSQWAARHEQGQVLDTGSQHDPYNGEYFSVAKRFAPSFNQKKSPLAPDSYVYGIEVDGTFKAYPRDLLPLGEIRDMINDEEIIITHANGKVVFKDTQGMTIPDVEGFWFSWVAVHPQTLIWSK